MIPFQPNGPPPVIFQHPETSNHSGELAAILGGTHQLSACLCNPQANRDQGLTPALRKYLQQEQVKYAVGTFSKMQQGPLYLLYAYLL